MQAIGSGARHVYARLGKPRQAGGDRPNSWNADNWQRGEASLGTSRQVEARQVGGDGPTSRNAGNWQANLGKSTQALGKWAATGHTLGMQS